MGKGEICMLGGACRALQTPNQKQHADNGTAILPSSQPTHFLAGFAFLPLFWAVNVWLFWPTVNGTAAPVDPVVKKCERVLRRRVML